jgi:hypothetical protein
MQEFAEEVEGAYDTYLAPGADFTAAAPQALDAAEYAVPTEAAGGFEAVEAPTADFTPATMDFAPPDTDFGGNF